MICASSVTSSDVVGSSAMSRSGFIEERHGDGDPLAHPAGELVRVVVDALLRVRDADPAQHLEGARPLGGGGLAASRYRMSTICAATECTGLSAVMGSWKTIAISRPRRARSSRGDSRQHVAALVQDLARLHRRVGRQQADHRRDDGGLAAAALADQSDDAPGRNREGHAAHGAHRPLRRVEAHAEVPDLEQLVAHRSQTLRRSFGSRMSRSASPRNVKPSVVTISAPVPATISQGVART